MSDGVRRPPGHFAKLRLQVQQRRIEVGHHLLDDTFETWPLLSQGLLHHLAPLLLEDTLHILHVDVRTCVTTNDNWIKDVQQVICLNNRIQ